jgi:hypothetical protein
MPPSLSLFHEFFDPTRSNLSNRPLAAEALCRREQGLQPELRGGAVCPHPVQPRHPLKHARLLAVLLDAGHDALAAQAAAVPTRLGAQHGILPVLAEAREAPHHRLLARLPQHAHRPDSIFVAAAAASAAVSAQHDLLRGAVVLGARPLSLLSLVF